MNIFQRVAGDDFGLIRRIALHAGWDEVLKWGHPCECMRGARIVKFRDKIIAGKGALVLPSRPPVAA